MKPLERACRSAHAEHNDSPSARKEAKDPAWDGWKSWLPVVTAALIVLREPSDRMILAAAQCEGALEATYPDSDGYFAEGGEQKIWKAMFDAMMAER